MSDSKEIAVTTAFSSIAAFESAQRMAMALCSSSLVPKPYQGEQNIGSALIALELAQRMDASPLMVMQNIDVIENRPTWRAQMAIAAINASGRFSPIRYEMSEEGDEENVEYFITTWDGRQKNRTRKTALIRNRSCVAYAYDIANGERLDGPLIDMRMAVREGWYGKQNSKWRSIPELMLRYRAASWWQRLYAPELLMGLPIDQDVRDAIDVTPENVVVSNHTEQTTAAEAVAKKISTANSAILDEGKQDEDAEQGDYAEQSEDVEFDSRGVKFDIRFHALRADGVRAVLPNGSFRKRRGHDQNALEKYEATFLQTKPEEQNKPDPEPANDETTKEPTKEHGFPEILTAIQRSGNHDDLRRAQEMLEGFRGPEEQKEELAGFVREKYEHVIRGIYV